MIKETLKKVEDSKKTGWLDLGRTKITYYNFIKDLHNLNFLDLSNNYIEDISFLERLTRLKYLNLSNNRIEDISVLKNLNLLETVDLSNNIISNLEPIKDLRFINFLNIENNRVRDLEPLVPMLEKGLDISTVQKADKGEVGLFLAENQLVKPGPEIGRKGRRAVLSFFRELRGSSQANLYEAKVLMVGEGGVGKTSLGIRLSNREGILPDANDRTRGIAITHLFFPQRSTEFKLNLWDFGGQDIYHSTHRFFLTKRSLYVLLTETRRQDDNFDYWIPNIRLFGGDSPILIVKNKYDNLQRQISVGQYKKNEEFNIVGNILEVNIKTNEGLDRLERIIQQQAENLPLVGNPVPSTYVDVKDRLFEISKDQPYISLEEFLEICQEEKIIDDNSAITLAGYLHDLGNILWYQDIPGLKDKIIIQPEWATKAVYLIIDDSVIQSKAGLFDMSDIYRLWTDSSYKGLHYELLLLLEAFKLCYKKRNKEEYVIPSLLPLDPPQDFHWDFTDNLILQFEYTFMPKGMVNQLTAQLDKFIKQDRLVWGAGVVLSDGMREAIIEENRLKRRIIIRVRGIDPSYFLGTIVNTLEDIHSTYPGIEVLKKIPCACKECIVSPEPQLINFEDLIKKYQKSKNPIWYCNHGEKFVLVKDLLTRVGAQELTSFDHENFKSFVSKNKAIDKKINGTVSEIDELIINGKTKKALELALSFAQKCNLDEYIEIVMLSSSFNSLAEEFRKNTIELGSYRKAVNKIHDSILKIIHLYE
ncbi:MAG: leucine-rich repeat domain-containing protein [Bacteroidia bacterium]|nr:leucine-rich repeat domain-containing protein [Bacteroidia bacterium]